MSAPPRAAYVSRCVDDWDVEGSGATMPDALRALAADCRRSAAQQQRLVDLLLEEAQRAERAADGWARPLAIDSKEGAS